MLMGKRYSFLYGYGMTVMEEDGNVVKGQRGRPFVILAGNGKYQPKEAHRKFEAICKTGPANTDRCNRE